jgi:hypothetical protein
VEVGTSVECLRNTLCPVQVDRVAAKNQDADVLRIREKKDLVEGKKPHHHHHHHGVHGDSYV